MSIAFSFVSKDANRLRISEPDTSTVADLSVARLRLNRDTLRTTGELV